jgi:hypothetical protein
MVFKEIIGGDGAINAWTLSNIVYLFINSLYRTFMGFLSRIML